METRSSRHSKRQVGSDDLDNQSHSRKRQRTNNNTPRSDPSPSRSAVSQSSSIGQWYGIGDEDVLSNLFASHPETFTTVPCPNGSHGLYAPMRPRGSCDPTISFTFRTISLDRGAIDASHDTDTRARA
ncbi:hypothetical protein B0T26DRAFT_495052 [Lasiosphaeria miniovina]|uniref:Uncharacterized protein n=1 Tax=Lasiosphaeria miniovina TaxID=1954250 RepID=A0AA39ZTK7_9PEZI|nr:uncharacterized protein B0T26DRAFT_495052 [Lasiosphaeria miniovina]KAK0703313.1 hypothetical protein B0T26DRAFT_495052 [Lasiosphaeria miniovina]